MRRGPLPWLVAAAGVVLVLGVVALIGNGSDRNETVAAGEWAQNVCGSIGAWRGELEAIVEDIRTPSAFARPVEEPQSETPQGRTGFVRAGLERGIEAADTLVEGIDNAGTPDTPEGDAAAREVSDWADAAHHDLEEAEESLDNESDTLEESIDQVTGAARAIAGVLTSGAETLVKVGQSDPELAAALGDSSTCQQLREERS